MKRSRSIQLSIVTSVAAAVLAYADDTPKRPCDDPNQKVAGQLACPPSRFTSYPEPGGRRHVKHKGTKRGGIGASGEAKVGAHAAGGKGSAGT